MNHSPIEVQLPQTGLPTGSAEKFTPRSPRTPSLPGTARRSASFRRGAVKSKFLAVMWAAPFSPGPDMLLLLKNALNHSRSSALATVLGIVCGLCVHSAVILSGLAVVLRERPSWFAALRLTGGLYLIYLAGKLLRWGTHASFSALATKQVKLQF